MKRGFAGLVKEFGFDPERLESQGSKQMAGCHGPICISERPFTCRRLGPGMDSEEQAWKKGYAGRLWKNPEVRRWWQKLEK